MQVEVKMRKEGKWIAVDAPAARIYTQGESEMDAAAMLADAAQMIADEYGIDSRAKVVETADGWALEFDSDAALIAFVLRRNRKDEGISIGKAAKAIGQSSKRAVARYETGKQPPTIATLQRLLKAVAPDVHLRLVGAKK